MDYIKDEVNKLVKKYKTRDPFELCNAVGISVLEYPLHSYINGIYRLEQGRQIVTLNDSLDKRYKIITCCHELGHARLHRSVNCTFMKNHTFFDKNKIERAANLFMAHLMIEDKLLFFNGHTINEVAHELNVPVELLQLKLEGNKIFLNV